MLHPLHQVDAEYRKYLQDVYDNTALSVIQVEFPTKGTLLLLSADETTLQVQIRRQVEVTPANSSLGKWRFARMLGQYER